MKVAVCGHANLDVQLQVRDLPKAGQSTPVLERRTVWGGTGANIARHAGGLGVDVRLWARVGADFPADWRAALKADGVDLRLETVPGAQTPTCFVLTDLVERQAYCMDEGPMRDIGQFPPPSSLLDGMRKGDWLHVATGDPLGYAALADEARLKGLSVALDPGQEMRFQYDVRSLSGMLSLADILFLNEEELRVACGILDRASAEELLGLVPAVVVTRGAKEVTLHRRGEPPLHVPVEPVRVVDPTGAGDAFRAGWYAALGAGRPWDEAVRWGSAAAGVVLQHVGAQGRVVRKADIATARGKDRTA
ncbi:MAG: carbohydrate kinase family protein [Thermoplasmatota archaeon]|nr:carbohydrate kinase family protein [Halobacteriales archaeon]